MQAHHSLGKVFALLALAACAACSADTYRDRDGKAEALADIKRGAALKIYSHVANGFAMGSESPGLVNCSREYVSAGDKFERFAFIDEAAFQEGESRTYAQDRLAFSAVSFARAYNITTYHVRRHEVERLCPKVRLE